MNKTMRNETSTRLGKRLDNMTKQYCSILRPVHYNTLLLTTEELAELARLEMDQTLLGIEIETFLADVKSSRNPITFLKRHIFNNR